MAEVWWEEGFQSQSGSEEHPAPHQKEVLVSMTQSRQHWSRSSVPQDPVRVEVQAGDSSWERQEPPAQQTHRAGVALTSRQTQDCLEGERKVTSCLGSVARVGVGDREDPTIQLPLPFTHLQVTV